MSHQQPHRLTGVRALRALADLGFASVAAGVIARRPPVMKLLERLRADSRALDRIRAHLIDSAHFQLRSEPRPQPGRPLPVTFGDFSLDFTVEPTPATVR
ncbi:hypothetical protein ACWEKT_40620 [Nocardia takedensis]